MAIENQPFIEFIEDSPMKPEIWGISMDFSLPGLIPGGSRTVLLNLGKMMKNDRSVAIFVSRGFIHLIISKPIEHAVAAIDVQPLVLRV